MKYNLLEIKKLVFVIRFVVMKENLRINVMMEILIMMMDVQLIVKLKLDGHVLVVQQLCLVHVCRLSLTMQLLYQLVLWP